MTAEEQGREGSQEEAMTTTVEVGLEFLAAVLFPGLDVRIERVEQAAGYWSDGRGRTVTLHLDGPDAEKAGPCRAIIYERRIEGDPHAWRRVELEARR